MVKDDANVDDDADDNDVCVVFVDSTMMPPAAGDENAEEGSEQCRRWR